MNAKTHAHPRTLWLVTLSAFACVAYAGGALGADPSDAPSITVSFGDLNIGSSAGAARLYGRIENAARTVCGPRPAAADLRGSQLFRGCYTGAVSSAVAKVNAPALTALHDSKTGRKTPQLAKR